MGTRNLTMVIANGETKVAQYGQWDGYPSGVGITVLTFLNDASLMSKLRLNLNKCRFIDYEGKDKVFIESYDKNAPSWSNEPDNRTVEQKVWFDTYITRDLAAIILTNIANSFDNEIILKDASDFIEESSCEWAYIIDLDKNTLEVKNGAEKTYSLDELPDEDTFFKELEGIEEEN